MSTWRMIFKYLKNIIFKYLKNIFIIVIIGCPILNGMIHYNVCNDKGKYCTILWASGNYCGQLDLVIPLAHRLLALKPKCTPWSGV